MKSLVATLLLILCPLARTQDLVAILDIKFVKETEDVAEWMCYEENDQDCHPWAYFYLFDAKVKKIVAGDLNEKKFRILFGKHALKRGAHRNIIVTLSKLEKNKEAEYQVTEWGEEKEMYCFHQEANKKYNVRLQSSETNLNCYDKK